MTRLAFERQAHSHGFWRLDDVACLFGGAIARGTDVCGTHACMLHAVWEAEQKPDLEILYEDLEKPPRLVRSKTGLPAPGQAQAQGQAQPLLMHGLANLGAGFPPGLLQSMASHPSRE